MYNIFLKKVLLENVRQMSILNWFLTFSSGTHSRKILYRVYILYTYLTLYTLHLLEYIYNVL